MRDVVGFVDEVEVLKSSIGTKVADNLDSMLSISHGRILSTYRSHKTLREPLMPNWARWKFFSVWKTMSFFGMGRNLVITLQNSSIRFNGWFLVISLFVTKVKSFLWTVLHKRILTREKLHSLYSRPNSMLLCKDVAGTVVKILVDCTFSSQCWD